MLYPIPPKSSKMHIHTPMARHLALDPRTIRSAYSEAAELLLASLYSAIVSTVKVRQTLYHQAAAVAVCVMIISSSRLRPHITEFAAACMSYLPYFSYAAESSNATTLRAQHKDKSQPAETFLFLSALTTHLLSQPPLALASLVPLPPGPTN